MHCGNCLKIVVKKIGVHWCPMFFQIFHMKWTDMTWDKVNDSECHSPSHDKFLNARSSLLGNWSVSGIRRIQKPKLSVPTKAGHGPFHSADFNWLWLLLPTTDHPCQESHLSNAGATRTRALATGVQCSTS